MRERCGCHASSKCPSWVSLFSLLNTQSICHRIRYQAGRSGPVSSKCAITDGHFTESSARRADGKRLVSKGATHSWEQSEAVAGPLFRSCVRPTYRSTSRGNDGIPSPRLQEKTALIEQPIRFPLLNLTCKRKRNGLCNGRLTSSLCDMIKVSETDVWSHSTTLAPDLHGAACEVVSEFAL